MIGKFSEPLYEVRGKTKRVEEGMRLFTNRELLIAKKHLPKMKGASF